MKTEAEKDTDNSLDSDDTFEIRDVLYTVNALKRKGLNGYIHCFNKQDLSFYN